jgi:hypothetical protein
LGASRAFGDGKDEMLDISFQLQCIILLMGITAMLSISVDDLAGASLLSRSEIEKERVRIAKGTITNKNQTETNPHF